MEPRRALRAALMLGGKDAKPHDTRWEPNLADIPGLLFWHDPTDPSKMSVDPNDGIDLFIPQIGHSGNYSMTQATEANRPLSVAGPNGKKVVGFPVGDTRWLQKSAAPVDYTQGSALVIAWKAVAPGPIMSLWRNSGPNIRFDLQINGSSEILYRYGDFFALGQATRTITLGQWNITTVRTREHWLNGGDWAELSQGTLDMATPVLLEYGRMGNAGVSMQGELGHWLFIQGFITEGWLRQIEGFVAWDLGIQSQLVPGHPWENQAP